MVADIDFSRILSAIRKRTSLVCRNLWAFGSSHFIVNFVRISTFSSCGYSGFNFDVVFWNMNLGGHIRYNCSWCSLAACSFCFLVVSNTLFSESDWNSISISCRRQLFSIFPSVDPAPGPNFHFVQCIGGGRFSNFGFGNTPAGAPRSESKYSRIPISPYFASSNVMKWPAFQVIRSNFDLADSVDYKVIIIIFELITSIYNFQFSAIPSSNLAADYVQRISGQTTNSMDSAFDFLDLTACSSTRWRSPSACPDGCSSDIFFVDRGCDLSAGNQNRSCRDFRPRRFQEHFWLFLYSGRFAESIQRAKPSSAHAVHAHRISSQTDSGCSWLNFQNSFSMSDSNSTEPTYSRSYSWSSARNWILILLQLQSSYFEIDSWEIIVVFHSNCRNLMSKVLWFSVGHIYPFFQNRDFPVFATVAVIGRIGSNWILYGCPSIGGRGWRSFGSSSYRWTQIVYSWVCSGIDDFVCFDISQKVCSLIFHHRKIDILVFQIFSLGLASISGCAPRNYYIIQIILGPWQKVRFPPLNIGFEFLLVFHGFGWKYRRLRCSRGQCRHTHIFDCSLLSVSGHSRLDFSLGWSYSIISNSLIVFLYSQVILCLCGFSFYEMEYNNFKNIIG